MASKPTLSVIIPTFNMADYVGAMLETILEQASFDIEIIVIDDASTDNTHEILLNIVDHRLKTFCHPRNQGPSAARNTGLRHARGEFILALDADDVPVVENWQVLIETLSKDDDAILAYGAERVFQGNENAFPRTVPNDAKYALDDEIIPLIFCENFIQCGCAIIRRQACDRVGGWNEALRVGEDWDLWCRLACIGNFKYCPVLVVGYRQHHRSVMGSPLVKNVEDPGLAAVDSIFSNCLVQERCGAGIHQLRRKALGWLTYHWATRLFRNRFYWRGLKTMTRCILTDPSRLTDLFRLPFRKLRHNAKSHFLRDPITDRCDI